MPLHRIVLGLLAFAAATGCAERPETRPERIVLVTIDTLRADRVGCYGAARAHTPSLDTVAAQGVRFAAAVSPAPLTLPAHTTLMTGLQPPVHGVRTNSTRRLSDGVPTLAERLRDAGYPGAAFVSSFVLDRRFGLARGFETYDDRTTRRAPGVTSVGERPADEGIDAALEWLVDAPERFFLWVHLYDPHMAYEPPPGFASAFPDDPYAGEIAFADAQLGRLLSAIDERYGAAGNLVVVTADHGESLGEHGELTHSYTVYEATQWIPLVMRGPGLPSGHVVDAPVGLVDVAPTLLALAGADPLAAPGEPAVGRDLLPLIEGNAEGEPAAYVETVATRLDLGWSPLLGLRTRRFKYIRAPRPELYDLAADPDELRNLATVQPDRVAELDAELQRRLDAPSLAAQPVELDAANRERLQRLGYLTGGTGLDPDVLGEVGGPDPKDEIGLLRQLNAAQSLAAEERFDEALELLRPLADPSPAVAALRAAVALVAGDARLAERDIRSALAVEPEREDLRLVLVRALDAQGRRGDADRVLVGLPGDAVLDPALALRASARDAAEGRPEAALERLASAFERHPDEARLARAYGLRLAATGRHEQALIAWEAALAAAPDLPLTQNDVAWVLARLKRDLDRALALARAAAEGSGGEAHTLETLASVRLARGEFAEALEAIDRALGGAPPPLRPHLLLLRARALAGLGRAEQARAVLAEARATSGAGDEVWHGEAIRLHAELGGTRAGTK